MTGTTGRAGVPAREEGEIAFSIRTISAAEAGLAIRASQAERKRVPSASPANADRRTLEEPPSWRRLHNTVRYFFSLKATPSQTSGTTAP